MFTRHVGLKVVWSEEGCGIAHVVKNGDRTTPVTLWTICTGEGNYVLWDTPFGKHGWNITVYRVPPALQRFVQVSMGSAPAVARVPSKLLCGSMYVTRVPSIAVGWSGHVAHK